MRGLLLFLLLCASYCIETSAKSNLVWTTRVRGGGSGGENSSGSRKAYDSFFASDHETSEARQAIRKWRLEQQQYYQLRSTFLSEALAARGIPLSTMLSVSTVEGERAEKIDWDCALSTEEDPKTCLYSFDAQAGTKVVAPVGTDQWISLNALNRLRRMDPTKVEPMWHQKYLILQSWFGESETSLLQHVGIQGWLISAVLLDSKVALRSLLFFGVLSVLFAFMPALEYTMNAALVSEFFWSHYNNWARLVHAALPFKLLLAQMAWKFLSKKFDQLERRVRDSIVDVECSILEETVPITVGEGAEVFGTSDSNDEGAVTEKSFDEVENIFEDDFSDESY